MIIQQTRLFAKQKKKLHANQINTLDEAVRTIAENPQLEQQKKGELNLVRVYKFKIVKQECLLAYQYVRPKRIILLTVGTHENFYRDLKRNVGSSK